MYNIGILYIATSRIRHDIIKIGKTYDLETRMKSLYYYKDKETGRVLELSPYYAIEIHDVDSAEKIVLKLLNNRIGKSECFRIHRDDAVSLFKLFDGKQVYPKPRIDYYEKYHKLKKEKEKLEREYEKHVFELSCIASDNHKFLHNAALCIDELSKDIKDGDIKTIQLLESTLLYRKYISEKND